MINVYFFICVYSLHQILESERNENTLEQGKHHGYSHCDGSEMYNCNALEGAKNKGYQSSEFIEP